LLNSIPGIFQGYESFNDASRLKYVSTVVHKLKAWAQDNSPPHIELES
jgi:hypothetical protein